MEPHHIGLALISAFLHAGWNAAVKARPDPTRAMTVQMGLAALLMLPMLLVTGLPAMAALPWMLGSLVCNTFAVTALLNGYRHSSFGLVYPLSRALSVMLVVPGAALLLGERLGGTAIAGSLLIAAALSVLAVPSRTDTRIERRAFAWIAAAGLATATCVMLDVQGVRAAGSAIAYGCCTSTLNAVLMLYRQRSSGVTRAVMGGETRAMMPVAMASVTSYLLILYLYTIAPIAPSAALRDTSALFAILIAVVWLKERLGKAHIAALVLAGLAIPLLRLG